MNILPNSGRKLLLAGIALAIAFTQLHAAIIPVLPTPGAIQAAVNSAASGDTLLLTSGTYNESVDLGMAAGSISILTATPGGPIVNGGTGSAFFASSHTGDVTIAGLVLRSSSTNGNTGVVNFTDHTGRINIGRNSFDLGNGTEIFTAGIFIENTLANNPTQVSILDNSFGPFENDELIQIETAGTGGDVDIVVDGNTNTSSLEDGAIEIDLDRINITAIVVVRNNTFSGWAATGSGLDLNCDGENSEFHLLVDNNSFTGPDGDGINLNVAAISSDVYAQINGNTVSGTGNTDFGIFVDDESSAHSTNIIAFITNNNISNTVDSGIRLRPFNDVAATLNTLQIVIDGNTIDNPNTDMTAGFEEAGVDISDDSGIDDERYEVDVEITNNTFTNINAVTACILVEEPTTMTAGTADVQYLISGNTGCTSPTIRGGATTANDPVPASAGLGSIGDFVWADLNLDGDQDAGEPGVPGVTIAFTNGSLSGTTTTNIDGNYVIPSLTAGTYTLTITAPGSLPFITGQGLGGDATKDSDFDLTTGQATVVLAAGVDNVDIDAGLSQTAFPTCPMITFSNTKTDEGCPGANDGSISLSAPAGGMGPYTYSADSGMTYVSGATFSNLTPGVYQMRVKDADGCEADAVAVTVAAGVDNTNPMITCPAAQTVYLGANCDAMLGSYSAASVSDNCTNNPAVTQSPASMPITANTSVTLTATDASGNSANCSFMVMVSDTSSPSLSGASALMMSIGASGDATIAESDPDNNIGGNDIVHTGTSNVNQKRRGLFRFDIAGSIPAGATIDSVKLNLFMPPGNSTNPSDFDLFASLKDWGEGNKTGNSGSAASAGEVTWNSNFHSSSTWAAPGGQAGTDYANTASATTNVAGQGSYTWTGMQADVQNWLNNPASNFGWFLISQSENIGGTARRFVSKENTTMAQPELEVYYSLPGSDICGSTDTMMVDTSCNAIVRDYTASATAWDNCGTPSITQNPAAGSLLGVGVHAGQLTATDASGNTDNCSFTIEVLDDIAPEIVCPADQVVVADTSRTGMLGSYAAASATDNCGMPTVTQNPAAGTVISANTAVTLTATDASGNSSDCNFMVLLDTISISIDPLKAMLNIQAYPNPTSGLVTIQVEGATNQPLQAALFDVHGRLYLRKASQTSSFELDLSDFAKGVYFLRIGNGANVYGWEKLVVE